MIHSHAFTWRQEYRRNRAIGRIMERYSGRFGCGEVGEGMTLVRRVTAQLLPTVSSSSGSSGSLSGTCVSMDWKRV